MTNSVMTIGGGPLKVLALHGWFGSAEGWGPMVDVLDGHRFTYAFMDYRGYGGSKHVTGDYTLEEIAADALATADRLGWNSFHLLGHSMGGAAIQHVLAQAPARVRSLTGITPVPANGVAFDDAAWNLFSSAAGSPDARRGILDFSTGSRLSRRWLDQMLAHSLRCSSSHAFGAYLNSWARTDISARIAGSAVPVHVIAGEHDAGLPATFVGPAWSRWYPHATLTVMANAGHYPMFETPVALVTSIEGFLSKAEQAR